MAPSSMRISKEARFLVAEASLTDIMREYFECAIKHPEPETCRKISCPICDVRTKLVDLLLNRFWAHAPYPVSAGRRRKKS